jgi:hypothetical protein
MESTVLMLESLSRRVAVLEHTELLVLPRVQRRLAERLPVQCTFDKTSQQLFCAGIVFKGPWKVQVVDVPWWRMVTTRYLLRLATCPEDDTPVLYMSRTRPWLPRSALGVLALKSRAKYVLHRRGCSNVQFDIVS